MCVISQHVVVLPVISRNMCQGRHLSRHGRGRRWMGGEGDDLRTFHGSLPVNFCPADNMPPSRRRRRARSPPALSQRVIEAYNTPGHPIAFSAPSTVARYFGTTRGQARHILEHVDGYTSHREFKRPRRLLFTRVGTFSIFASLLHASLGTTLTSCTTGATWPRRISLTFPGSAPPTITLDSFYSSLESFPNGSGYILCVQSPLLMSVLP